MGKTIATDVVENISVKYITLFEQLNVFTRKKENVQDRSNVRKNINMDINRGDLKKPLLICFFISISLSSPPKNIRKARPNKDKNDKISEFTSTIFNPLFPMAKPVRISKATDGIISLNSFIDTIGIKKLNITIRAIESIII